MDDSLINTLTDVQDLYQRRLKASAAMEQGFFLMACAQKQLGARALKVEDIREDIFPSVRVVMEDGACRLVYEDSMETNGALLFSALPPPALKQAQAAFRKAIESITRQVPLVHQISQNIKQVNDARLNRS